MYNYIIYKQFDDIIFENQCRALEDNIPNLTKEKITVDVDGSKLQEYKLGDYKIKVYNDYQVDAVYIESDIELESYFRKKA